MTFSCASLSLILAQCLNLQHFHFELGILTFLPQLQQHDSKESGERKFRMKDYLNQSYATICVYIYSI